MEKNVDFRDEKDKYSSAFIHLFIDYLLPNTD